MKSLLKYSLLLFLFAVVSCSDGGDETNVTYQYHTPGEIETFLDEIKLKYPDITSIETVGYSESGRVIKALIISDNPESLEGEPAVRLTGGIHGNEMMGVELLLRFIEYLTSNYSSNSIVKNIVDSRYICIIPVLNPDGLARKRRYNDNDVDLNRNFNDTGNHWDGSVSSHGTSAFSESETLALQTFSSGKNFILSVTYHVGAVLVNMPFDYASKVSDGISPADYTLIKSYAKTYTTSGSFLSNPDIYTSTYMDEGTINGGDWYIITGSLGDWSYTQTQCLDLTIEVAKSNPSTEEDVEQVFIYNRDSLMSYIDKAGNDTFSGNKFP